MRPTRANLSALWSPGGRRCKTRSMKLVLAALALSILAQAGCAAPRDPELERGGIKARLARAENPDDDDDKGSEPPPGPASAEATATARPVKTWSGSEITAVLAAVGGAGKDLVAEIESGQGLIRCTLDERAAQSVANFVALATGQVEWQAQGRPKSKAPLYDGLTFHRAVQDFIIQTGNPTGRFNDGPGWRIARETAANDLFEAPGALAMIEDGDAAHGSQVFITARRDPKLGLKYAAFGRCEPVATVQAIANAEKKPSSGEGSPSAPLNPVPIKSVRILRTN